MSWGFLSSHSLNSSCYFACVSEIYMLINFCLIFFFFNFIFLKIYLFYYYYFYFAILYWFCHTSTCIHHRCTRVPNPEPPSQLSPHTIPLGPPSAPAPSILYPTSNLDWWFVSYMILYMFQCHSPNHPPLPSPTESKRLFYTSVSLLLSHRFSSVILSFIIKILS